MLQHSGQVVLPKDRLTSATARRSRQSRRFFVGDILAEVDAADAGQFRVGGVRNQAGDDLTDFARAPVVKLHGVEPDVQKGVRQMLADDLDIAAPAYIEEVELWELGVAGREPVRVVTAMVNAERPSLAAPGGIRDAVTALMDCSIACGENSRWRATLRGAVAGAREHERTPIAPSA